MFLSLLGKFIVCDVVDIDTHHLLLGKPWRFNVDVYESWWNSKIFFLVPLTNKKKNSKPAEKNFLTIVKGHLEDDCDGCKKLKKKKEFEMKTLHVFVINVSIIRKQVIF